MFSALIKACKSFINRVNTQLKKMTKPATAAIAVGTLTDLPRSRADLLAENAMLRQQLIVLKRSVKRPKFTTGDRVRLSLLARLTGFWQSALHLVQPDTLLRWHRDLFRWYWRRKSKPKKHPQTTPQTTIDLIHKMALENRTWGAEHIQGERLKDELLKLGIKLGKPTIQNIINQVRKRRSGQTWSSFLKNHAHQIWDCDFTVVNDLLFRPLYIFVIIAHKTRQIIHFAVTRHQTDAWVAQQLREATPWGRQPRFLIRDNDKKYGKQFRIVASSSSINELLTPIEAPRANAICERFIGSLRQECLDFFMIFNQNQLNLIVHAYLSYYNHHRPHQGIQQRIPAKYKKKRMPWSSKVKGKVILTPVLHGLHHTYAYAGMIQ
jgi:transposase InsO family protein